MQVYDHLQTKNMEHQFHINKDKGLNYF
uniref:Uncharacterized protein n=1 Tax=Anguilla anguilla TaxID=7936 RepID=A0A0E9S5D0_ANGAN